jgi:hypothetical protein
MDGRGAVQMNGAAQRNFTPFKINVIRDLYP